MTAYSAKSAIESLDSDIDIEIGLKVVSSPVCCTGDIDFDLVVKPIGRDCIFCGLDDANCLLIAASAHPGSIDPRNVEMLRDRISEFMDGNYCSKIAICGIENMLLWNGARKVAWILKQIDSMLRAKGVQGYLFLREDYISPEDSSIIFESFS